MSSVEGVADSSGDVDCKQPVVISDNVNSSESDCVENELEKEDINSEDTSKHLPEDKHMIANGSGLITDVHFVLNRSKLADIDHSSDDSGTESTETICLNAEQTKKVQKIIKSLAAGDVTSLKHFAISEYGLVTDDIRRKVWPKLIGVDVCETSPRPSKEVIESHPYHQQVLLDVNRSLKRFPPSIKERQRLAMQDQLVLLIMRILDKHPDLHYYQGYHDICVTFLLVLGEEVSFHVVDKLSMSHLNAFMQRSMEPTVEMLNYMYPVIEKENSQLYEFLEKSEVGVMFALSWLITWFGHVLKSYSDVVRLFDFFIVSSHWMPVYLSAAIVLHREKSILAQDCDMASVHALLLKIPNDLPFEDLLVKSRSLYKLYPPKTLKDIVAAQVRRRKAALKPRVPRRKRGIVYSVVMTVRDAIPKQKLTVSLFVAAAVLVGAVLYQAYKT